MEWELEGDKYGIKTIAYSFHNHVQHGKNQKVLTFDELAEGFEKVKRAAKGLKRNPNHPYPYVRNLLARNWFQVKHSTMVCAIGTFADKSMKRVSGGTGWAVQMAIDEKKPVYLFDQKSINWFKYNFDEEIFESIDYLPTLSENFAGIGTREIDDTGKRAIKEVLAFNCT